VERWINVQREGVTDTRTGGPSGKYPRENSGGDSGRGEKVEADAGEGEGLTCVVFYFNTRQKLVVLVVVAIGLGRSIIIFLFSDGVGRGIFDNFSN
jgi:hypothetical protein